MLRVGRMNGYSCNKNVTKFDIKYSSYRTKLSVRSLTLSYASWWSHLLAIGYSSHNMSIVQVTDIDENGRKNLRFLVLSQGD